MKFTMQGLALAGLDLVPPFQIDLRLDPNADVDDQAEAPLIFQTIERILPGRRLSGIAQFADRKVFAKLFYGDGARRYWQRELRGAKWLRDEGIQTPGLIDYGATADASGFVVLYQLIPDARTLSEDDPDQVLSAALLLAELHDANLVQTDVHLANFVTDGEQVYVVDADGLRRAQLLRQQFRNLALLLAQRAPWHDDDIYRIWSAYALQRGEYVQRMGNFDNILTLTIKERANRVKRYLKKMQRECGEIIQRKKFTRDFLCDREHWARLQRFMVLPESYLGDGTPLKLGNSATVVRCEIEGVRYVVKRYNIKNWSHRVRRWFKRRARNAWLNGHWLHFLSIPTAKPIALLERRWGWFTGVSYLVMPDAGDWDLGQVLSTAPESFDTVADEVVELISHMQAAGLVHGDLKATNFIQTSDTKRMLFIDYDAIRTGDIAPDVQRFLANWEDQPEVKARWRQLLAEQGL